MAITFPGADFDPLGKQTQDKMSAHDIVCLHTMAGSLAGTAATFEEGGFSGVESHFGVGARGELVQWQDLEFRADANLDGNHHVISIETADTGSPFPSWEGSNVPGWTKAQLDTIVDLVSWLCEKFDIPTKLIPDTKPGRRGIGYHRQGIVGSFNDGLVPGGEKWSESTGKVCPGDRRVRQLKRTVIPRIQGQPGKGRGGAEPMPRVSLDRLVKMATADVLPAVRVVEQALVAEGVLDEKLANGSWGPRTTAAYAEFQKKCGFKGDDADGIPGAQTLEKLGKAHGFKVV